MREDFIAKQFVPSDFCLKCLGCCRFLKNPTIWAPSQCELTKCAEGYVCENFKQKENRCKIYSHRPLDCQLYPFLLIRNNSGLKLGLHKSCYFIEKQNPSKENIHKYVSYLKRQFQGREFASILMAHPQAVAPYQEDVEILADLDGLFEKIYLPKLNKLSIRDKTLIDNFLKRYPKGSSAYNFVNIFIWRDFFKIFWAVIENNLCIFYQDKIGMFMPLPPLGELNKEVVRQCFEIMSFHNQGSSVSRIENVTENDLVFYSQIGFSHKLKDSEYICLREDLAGLSGDNFKSKRSACNQFSRNNDAKVLEYNPSMFDGCLRLYFRWMALRKEQFKDTLYQQMLEDSALSFKTALRYYKKLDLLGYVVRTYPKTNRREGGTFLQTAARSEDDGVVERALRQGQATKPQEAKMSSLPTSGFGIGSEVGEDINSCSFGYRLNKETFCILFEVCDLELKGIAQFIFREFAKKLSPYKYLNLMGSSELDNLRKVKLSYRPIKELRVYNICK